MSLVLYLPKQISLWDSIALLILLTGNYKLHLHVILAKIVPQFLDLWLTFMLFFHLSQHNLTC